MLAEGPLCTCVFLNAVFYTAYTHTPTHTHTHTHTPAPSKTCPNETLQRTSFLLDRIHLCTAVGQQDRRPDKLHCGAPHIFTYIRIAQHSTAGVYPA